MYLKPHCHSPVVTAQDFSCFIENSSSLLKPSLLLSWLIAQHDNLPGVMDLSKKRLLNYRVPCRCAGLVGMALMFFIVAHMVQVFGICDEYVLIIPPCFSCCRRVLTESRSWLLMLCRQQGSWEVPEPGQLTPLTNSALHHATSRPAVKGGRQLVALPVGWW